MPKILLTILLISNFSWAETLAGTYLNADWEKVDTNLLKTKFNAYVDYKKDSLIEVYFNSKSSIYALYTESVFLNRVNRNICSSELNIKYISNDLKALNIHDHFLGRKYFLLNDEGQTCDDEKSKKNFALSIGYVNINDAYYILSNIKSIKSELKKKASDCDIAKVKYLEQRGDDKIEAMLFGENNKRFMVYFEKKEGYIKSVDCSEIAD